MSVKIRIPNDFLHYTNDKRVIEVDGITVSECLDSLVKQFGEFKKIISGDFFNIYMNRAHLSPMEMDEPVKDDDELYFVAAT